MNRLQALRGPGRRSAAALRSLLADLWSLGRGLLLVGSGTPRAATVYVALVLLMALLPVLQVWLTKLLLDAVTTGAGGVTAAVGWAVTLAAVYALTLVVPAALTPVQRVLSAWLEERAVAELDGRLIRTGTRLADLVRLERPVFQDQLRLVRRAATQDLPRLFPLLEMGGSPLLSLVGLFWPACTPAGFLHPLLPVVLAAVSVPHFVSEYRMHRLQYRGDGPPVAAGPRDGLLRCRHYRAGGGQGGARLWVRGFFLTALPRKTGRSTSRNDPRAAGAAEDVHGV